MAAPSMVAERTESALRLRPGVPFVVLHGAGVTDHFMGRDSLVRDVEQEIHQRLISGGFERVIFSSRENPLYFVDGDPREQSRTAAQQAPRPRTVKATLFADKLHGPKTMPAGAPDDAGEQQAPGQRATPSVALRQIDGWMRQTKIRTALVIRNGADWVQFLRLPNNMGATTLTSYMRRWIEPELYGYHNLCIFLLGDIGEATQRTLGHLVPALEEFFQEHPANGSIHPDHPIVAFGYPTGAELHRLLQVARLKYQPDVKWDDVQTSGGRDLLAEAMFADPTSKRLAIWEARLASLSCFSIAEMGAKGMIENASADGRSALQRFNEDFIGQEQVKELVAKIQQAALREAQARRDGKPLDPPMRHLIFEGNPGTGKTEVARLIGEIYREAGVLARGHTHEVRAADIVGGYVGQTAPLMDGHINSALDGVLFIDEAHQLTKEGRNEHAAEAIETLVPRLENDRARFVAIAAGYAGPDYMELFRTSDPGMPSRFPRVITFEDYTPDQLYDILQIQMRKRRIALSEEADPLIRNVITGFRNSGSKEFQNARSMRQLAEDLEFEASSRGDFGPGGALIIQPDDLPEKHRQYLRESAPTLEEVLAKLDDLVGLQKVKDAITNLYKASIVGRSTGAPESTIAPHLIFTGNPGTGKTSVAKLMGELYLALGLLPTANIRVVSREDLIRGYIGQSEGRTAEVIEQSMGGILFVDEAHQLGGGGENDFGKPVLGTIIRAMLERRGEFAVIFAGYDDKMAAVYESEPGLKRRFTYTFTFEDYSTDELVEILMRMAAPRLRLSPEAVEKAAKLFDTIRRTNPGDFGNAGAAEKMLMRAKTNQAARIFDNPDSVDYETILPEDLPDASELV